MEPPRLALDSTLVSGAEQIPLVMAREKKILCCNARFGRDMAVLASRKPRKLLNCWTCGGDAKTDYRALRQSDILELLTFCRGLSQLSPRPIDVTLGMQSALRVPDHN